MKSKELNIFGCSNNFFYLNHNILMSFYRSLYRFNIFILVIIGFIYIGYEINFLKKSTRILSKIGTKKMVIKGRFPIADFQLNYVKKYGPGNLTRYQKLPEAIIIGEEKCGEYKFTSLSFSCSFSIVIKELKRLLNSYKYTQM